MYSCSATKSNQCSSMLFVIVVVCFILISSINGEKHSANSVRVNKCCERFEILVDSRCTHVNETDSGIWSPIFTDYNGRSNIQVPDYWFAVGIPECGQRQMWPISHDPTSRDRLALLPDGKLRHYIQHPDADPFDTDENSKSDISMQYDYAQGKYCIDKSISTKGLPSSEFAMVCNPEKHMHWTETEFLLRKIVNPIFHGISITILLFVAVVYFVLPTLRDLVGNIITTITCCLIVNQASNLIRIFTEFKNHVNFLILDIVAQVSVMAAFFWLSSLGYYIWKTFRSRNVFLRITDGTKYCWYSFYAWGSTICMASLGVFAHFVLDISTPKKSFIDDEQESIGYLGLSIFFITVGTTIGSSIYFYISTQNYLNSRMHSSYGRIHYKLLSNFIMFSLLLCMLSITWIFSIFSWFENDGMFYMNLTISAIQAPLILYICVLRQKHVTYLLQKSCCSKQPLSAADMGWGDEMTYINTANG